MNPKPIFAAALELKRILLDDETAMLTAAEINRFDEAIQSAVGGHVAPSGSMGPRDTLSLRGGHPDGPEGEE